MRSRGDGVSTPLLVAVLVAIAVSFTLSSAAGMGGSLVLIPVLIAVVGVKEGIALSALLLAANNVAKVIAYRTTLPFFRTLPVVAMISFGALLGSRLLVAAPEWLVGFSVVAMILWAFLMERRGLRFSAAPMVLGFGGGALSGFSGSSGPLKGVALRSLSLDRMHLVGGASLASLAGDATKSAVFAEAGLLPADAAIFAVASVPLMVIGAMTGRRINNALNERGYAMLFWLVMTGYGARLILT